MHHRRAANPCADIGRAVRGAAALALPLVLVALGATGCGGGDATSTPAAAPTATGTSTPAAAPTATGTSTTVVASPTGTSATPASPASDATTVSVAVFQFEPVPLTVPAGTTVTFVNHDDTTHEPMSGAPGAVTGTFDVRLEGRGATGTVTLSTPGTYAYFCGIHDAMTGEIVVTS